jgi:hypothetical protein
MRYSCCATTGERYRVLTFLQRRSWGHMGCFWLMVTIPLAMIGLIGLTLAMGTHTIADVAAHPGLLIAFALWGTAFIGLPALRYLNARRTTTQLLAAPGNSNLGRMDWRCGME